MFYRPGLHLPHGGILSIQPVRGSHLAGSGLLPCRRLLSKPQRVPGQDSTGTVPLPGIGQQPGPVGAQRLQHLVPGPVIRSGPRRAQQRAVHQVQHRRTGTGPGHHLGRLQRERSRERRHQAEHPPLLVIEQPVAPLHRGRQRPVPAWRQPVPASQHREPVTKPVQQLDHAQRLHPRRRQLDRQRHPVQPRHDPGHQRPALAVDVEMHIGPAGPVREQRHRIRTASASRVIQVRQGQRPQPVPRLPGHRQRLPAGRQHPHIITGRQQPGAQPGGRADHMLAVVQHQQQLLPGQHPRQHIGHRYPRLVRHPQRRRHHRGNQRRVSHRRQLRQPRPVREPPRHIPGHLTGQPGLPHAARAGDRHQPVLLQQASDLTHRAGPADKARQHGREPMHATIRGRHRRPPHARTLRAEPRRRTALPHKDGPKARLRNASSPASDPAYANTRPHPQRP